jgi:glucan phosphoethanolaminetransferase (alkaline phosphatase superfamily)
MNNRDNVIKWYKTILTIYYPILFLLFIILAIINHKYLPRDACFIGLLLTIIGEVGIFIDYVNYKNKLKNKENKND